MIDHEGSGIVGLFNGCLLELVAAAVLVLLILSAHTVWIVLRAAWGF